MVDQAVLQDILNRLDELEQFQAFHQGIAVGSAGMNYPHPYLKVVSAEFGISRARLDPYGVQIVADLSTSPGIYFVNSMQSNPYSTYPRSRVFGIITSTIGESDIEADSPSSLVSGRLRMVAQDTIVDVTLSASSSSFGGPSLNLHSDNIGGGAYHQFNGAPIIAYSTTVDPAVLFDGMFWYRSDLFRPHIRSNGITGNIGVEIQSSTAPAVGTGGTIATAGVSAARVSPTGAVTGVILAVGTTGGQMIHVINEAVAANTITFAAAGTSNVADGVSSVIAGLNARSFVWDSGTNLWYPCK